MRVERITRFEQLANQREAWDRLAGDNPFRQWSWLEGWWRHSSRRQGPSADDELYLVAATADDGHLAAVLPCRLHRSSRRGAMLTLLGDGEICSDYLGLLCRDENYEQASTAVAHWLSRAGADRACKRDRWDVLELEGISPDDQPSQRLVRELVNRNNDVATTPSFNCWRLDLTSGWEGCVERLSKSHRKQIRRLERQLADGAATMHWADSPARFEYALATLIKLHQRRRRSLGEGGCFASPTFTSFHTETARALYESGALRLGWLELDGDPVAVEYQFAGGAVTYAYQSGVDPTALDYEPGKLATIATIQRAIAEGRETLDFLRGDEPYKAHWRAEQMPMSDVRVVPDRVTARLRNQVYSTARWAKRRIKGMLASAPAAPALAPKKPHSKHLPPAPIPVGEILETTTSQSQQAASPPQEGSEALC